MRHLLVDAVLDVTCMYSSLGCKSGHCSAVHPDEHPQRCDSKTACFIEGLCVPYLQPGMHPLTLACTSLSCCFESCTTGTCIWVKCHQRCLALLVCCDPFRKKAQPCCIGSASFHTGCLQPRPMSHSPCKSGVMSHCVLKSVYLAAAGRVSMQCGRTKSVLLAMYIPIGIVVCGVILALVLLLVCRGRQIMTELANARLNRIKRG